MVLTIVLSVQVILFRRINITGGCFLFSTETYVTLNSECNINSEYNINNEYNRNSEYNIIKILTLNI